MRVLFYLPLMWQWWFDNVVAHLIRTLAEECEVHVIVCPLWRNTGIGPEQLRNCDDLTHVNWHIWDADDHPECRFSVDRSAGLLDLIHAIDADITLCRSADVAGPLKFPGTVRFMMEGGALPLATCGDWMTFTPMLFDNGVMPMLNDIEQAHLDSAFAPAWAGLAPLKRAGRSDGWREAMGLPVDRPIISLPLEWEDCGNFFALYRRLPNNIELVTDVANRMPEGCTLAVTNHPLNVMHCDNRTLHATIAQLGDKVHLLPDRGQAGAATHALAANCDGMIIENSKSFSAAAFHGVPLQRTSRFPTAPWLNTYGDLEAFFADIGNRTAKTAREQDVRSWLGYHVANNLIDPDHPDHDAADLIARIERPHDPRRWNASIDRYLGIDREAKAC